jgi:hypothetical protein
MNRSPYWDRVLAQFPGPLKDTNRDAAPAVPSFSADSLGPGASGLAGYGGTSASGEPGPRWMRQARRLQSRSDRPLDRAHAGDVPALIAVPTCGRA